MADSIITRCITKMTEGVETDLFRPAQVLSIGVFSGVFFHFLFIFLFLLINVKEMAIFNIGSVTAWLFSGYLLRKGHFYISSIIGMVEIFAHAFLSVHYIGLGFGFQFYFFFPMIVMIVININNIFRLVSCILSIFGFILSNVYAYIISIEWTGNKLVMNIIYNSNIITFFILSGVFILYFKFKLETSEKILNETNEKLEGIGNNLKKYLPLQLVDSIIKGKEEVTIKNERKKLTIFFFDIKGFTEITDAMEPEELSSMLNEYITEMTVIAHKWGGTIDKFVGDAMMVFFGAPGSTNDKDHAIKCVKMAMEMQEKMKEMKDKWFKSGIEHPLEIRVGVNTGITAVGSFGAEDRLSYTAIGGQVNLASRLEGLAEPGGILISHSTWGLVNDEIECRVRDDKVEVKGIHREILVYDVVIG